ncbi:MAG: SgcJ/EcaC family oxidoreductase [Chloroflexota bacterium]
MPNPWTQQQIAATRATNAALGYAADEEKLRKLWDRFELLYNQHDAQGLTNLYAPNGTRFNPQGQFANGRPEVQRQYEAIFENEEDPGSDPQHSTIMVRFLRPDVALLDGRWEAERPNGEIAGYFTVTAIKENGRWYIAAGRDRGFISVF